MAGRLASLLPPKPDRRLIILLILLVVLIAAAVAAAVLLLRQPTAGQPAAAPAELAAADLAAAAAPYTAAIERSPNVADGYRGLSLLYLEAGRQADATAVWERAAKANPGQTWPLLGLGGVQAAAGDLLAARDTYYRAAALDPQDSAAAAALASLADDFAKQQAIKDFLAAQMPDAAPELLARDLAVLRQPLANGWTFLGYYGDLLTLAAGRSASLWTFWQAPTTDAMPAGAEAGAATGPTAGDVAAGNPVAGSAGADAAWRQVAPGIWGQRATATNLVQNGSFEGQITQTGPDGFSDELFAADAVTRQVRRLPRGNQFTTAAVLANDADNPNSSLVSAAQPLPPGSVLLVAADVHSEGGSASLAWAWPGAPALQNWPVQGSTQAGRADAEWQTLRAVAVPPPTAQTAQVQLLNTDSSGSVYFDNVLLAPIAAPAPLWPVVADAASAPAATATPAPARRSAAQELGDRFLAQMSRYIAWPAIAQDKTWQAELAAIGPVTRIDQTLSSGWRLEGYSTTDESRLARGERAPLVLYWQGPPGVEAGPAAAGWIETGPGRWLQFLPDAANSVTGGDFEAGLDAWGGRLFASPAATRRLAVTARGPYSTTVGVLTNTLVFSSTSFATAFQPVTPGQLFLQAGWLRSDGARGYIGHQWSGDLKPQQLPFDRYVVGADEENTWRHFAGVAEPLAGADQVRVLLLNYLAEGAAYFDDILFVPIAAPGPVLAGEEVAAAQARALLAEYSADPAVTTDERWLEAVAATGPARLLDQGMDDGWSFVGFTTDEEALAAGAMAPIFYFWQGPPGVMPGSAQDGWYNIDAGLWLAIDRTGSLFPSDGRLTLADAATEDASTAGPVKVDRRLFYLLAGRLGSGGSLNVTWQDAAGSRLPRQKIAAANSAADWTAAAGLLTPPPDAAAVEVVLTGASNGGESGSAEAEQLLLLPVEPPAPLAPAVGARPLTQLYTRL